MIGNYVFLIHVVTTLFLTGLIWTIQLLNYPLFAYVPQDSFNLYYKHHVAYITYLVALPMILEMTTAVFLGIRPLSFVKRRWAGLNFFLIVGIWISTYFIQVPQHNILAHGYNDQSIAVLSQTNWIRTILWTTHAAIVLFWIKECLNQKEV